MKQVTIIITKDGWHTKVEIGNKVYNEVHKRTEMGSRGVSGDFEAEKVISDDLYDALNGFGPYNIMDALKNS